MRNAYSKHTVKDATVTITDGAYEYVLEVPEVELMLYSIHNDDPWMHSGTLFTHFEGEAPMLTLRKLSDEEEGRDESAAYYAEIASHDAQAAALSHSDGMTHIQWDCGVECSVSYSPRRYPEEFCMLHAQAHGRADGAAEEDRGGVYWHLCDVANDRLDAYGITERFEVDLHHEKGPSLSLSHIPPEHEATIHAVMASVLDHVPCFACWQAGGVRESTLCSGDYACGKETEWEQ